MAAHSRREPYRVFISYSHKDRWIARQLVNLIEALGKSHIHAFLDAKDVAVGGHIAETVLEGIRRCDEFVVLLSVNSKDRPWVMFEIGAARIQKRPVVAILHNLNPQDMPEMIYPFKAIDLNDFSQYLTQLRARIKQQKTKTRKS